MTEWVCTDPDTCQWQRKDGDVYEMTDVILRFSDDWATVYYAVHGHFSLDDYDSEDHEWALKEFGYKPGEVDDDILAECLFECNATDLEDIESFDTFEEAEAYLMQFVKE